jgi:hypothetical protein
MDVGCFEGDKCKGNILLEGDGKYSGIKEYGITNYCSHVVSQWRIGNI